MDTPDGEQTERGSAAMLGTYAPGSGDARAMSTDRKEHAMVASTDIELRQQEGGTVAYQQFRGTIAAIESATSGVRSWVVTMGFKPEGPMAVEITGDPTGDH